MDTFEKLGTRLDELVEMLGRTQIGTEPYDKILDEIDTICKILNTDRKTEIDRLNANERNDIDRTKIDVEVERLKIENKKINAGIFDSVWNGAVCAGFSWIAYNGDKVSYAIKNILDVGKAFLPRRRK